MTALELLQLQLRISLLVASCEISDRREKRADQDWPEGRDDRPIGKALELGFRDGQRGLTSF